MPPPPHISVCVCTCRRPGLLERLLLELALQKTAGLFSFGAVVVDNDAARSGEATVKRCAAKTALPIDYHVEPERNIARARNRAVLNARGDFVAFIDDDEFPAPGWLHGLFVTCRDYAADGVLGPVLPHFDTPPPAWLTRSGLCDRTRYPTGTELTRTRQMRTGNVLFRRAALDPGHEPFDPAFGETGGEDADFFGQALLQGRRFVWCDEAPVSETVPPERWSAAYHLRRALLHGRLNRSLLAKRNAPRRRVALLLGRSAFAALFYVTVIPVTCIRGRHFLMRYLVKASHHIGLLAAYLGISTVGDRSAIVGSGSKDVKTVSLSAGVLRIATFFVLAGLSALALDRLITGGLHRIRTSEFGVINAVLSGRVNADIVISGSSRALVHYDPRVLANATGMSVYNIGRNGAQTDTQVAFLKAYLKHNAKPALVLHNLDPYSFATTREVYNPVQYIPYLNEDAIYSVLLRINPRVWRWKYVPLYGYAVEDMRFGWCIGLRALLGYTPKEDHIMGYTPQNRTWTGEFDRFRAANPGGVTFKIETQGVADIEQLMKLCSEAGIPLLLVFSPEYRDAQALEKNREDIFALFETMASSYGIPFWDYSDSELSRRQDCFYNSQHLNARGATLFSRELGARLAARKPWSAATPAPRDRSRGSS